MKQSVYKLLVKTLIALDISILFKLLFARDAQLFGIDLVVDIAVILLIWEGNTFIDQWLNKKYNWTNSPGKRLLAQAIAFTLFTSVALFMLVFVLGQIRGNNGRPNGAMGHALRDIFFPALLIAITLITIYISYNFFTAWKKSLISIEQYKTESANAQLQNLKHQLNPHFLFNNLSVLTSLVYKDQDKAVDFINELAKIYRYVLDNTNAELVTVQEELDFLSHYSYLLKIRFDQALSFEINIDEAAKQALVPPMCLQMLVENTIQHNEASIAKPLTVTLYTTNNSLVIENNLQPRTDNTVSSQLGLENIQTRYSYFTHRKVLVFKSEDLFRVSLPLITKS